MNDHQHLARQPMPRRVAAALLDRIAPVAGPDTSALDRMDGIRPDATCDTPVAGQPLAGGTLSYKRRISAERQAAYWGEIVATDTDHGFTIGIRPEGDRFLLVWADPS